MPENKDMKKLLFILLMLSIPFQYSCGEKTVRYSDSGKTIHLGIDQVLKIELPGDATSGSDWRKIAYNDSILMRKGKGNYMLSSDPSYPGVYYFRFRPIQTGTSKIYMEYGNKYDDDKGATKTFELEVIVVARD